MIKLNDDIKKELLDLQKSKRVQLEGNILKLIEVEDDTDFGEYIKSCIERDSETRKKRLEITRQIQKQNSELISWKKENIRIQEELVESLKNTESAMDEVETARIEAESARIEAVQAKEESDKARIEAEIAKNEAENAKAVAENDLELAQKKTQYELIGTIVKVALWVIISVGIITTGVFVFSLVMNKDTAIIGSTWSNIVGILLTNAFSIVGTIMGVKYASEKN
jgi:multidrug efflux pump subunit AcrA (membrane-fusion protein)